MTARAMQKVHFEARGVESPQLHFSPAGMRILQSVSLSMQDPAPGRELIWGPQSHWTALHNPACRRVVAVVVIKDHVNQSPSILFHMRQAL